MHGDGIVHQTVNPFAADGRPIFFISDPPHLIKTIRNNLSNSKSGGSRCLWVGLKKNLIKTRNFEYLLSQYDHLVIKFLFRI